jgi:phenylacetaldehyde dehydrogenase
MTETLSAESAPVSQALNRVPRSLYIDGEFTDAASGATLPVVDPATGLEVARVPEAGAEDVDRAVAAARRAFESGPWPALTNTERARIVWRIGELIEENLETFAVLESLDVGKPLAVSQQGDIPFSAKWFFHTAGLAMRLDGRTAAPSLPGAWHGFTLRRPLGVVGAITPWNTPLIITAWKLAPALATGNTVVLKPAEETPLTALFLATLLEKAGVPKGVVNVVTGFGHTAGAAISAHPGVDKVSFTGSTEVGRRIVRAAADSNLKRVSLELGGKSANIVMPDADLSLAIPGSADAVFANSGQVCTAGTRLFAHSSIYDEVVEGIAERARALKVGGAFEDGVTLGPLVSAKQRDTVVGYLESGSAAGARAVTGGAALPGDGYFVAPTVLTDVTPEMRVVREEIFGPVLVAQPFDTLDEVIAKANDTEYGLAAGVWTRDLSAAHRCVRELHAGTVWVNTFNLADPSLPFGGVGQSGWGREHGEGALELYTEPVSAVMYLG